MKVERETSGEAVGR